MGANLSPPAAIFDAVRDAGITGFAIVSGDRHSFWAGYAAKALPPAGKFEPVGVVAFVGDRSHSPDMQEAQEHGRKDNPLRALYNADGPGQAGTAARSRRGDLALTPTQS